MKLYMADYAPNPRRVRWILAEKAITGIDIEPVDLMTGQHRAHPRLRASGVTEIPLLELDDGTLIAESIAIGRYLESLYPEPNLFGRNPLETAEIEMWCRRAELNLSIPLMHATRMKHPLLAVLEAPNPPVAEYFLDKANLFAAVLDRQLEGRDFIAADRLTIADIVAFCGLDFARIIRHRPDRDHAHLGRWAAMMRERPAAHEAPRR